MENVTQEALARHLIHNDVRSVLQIGEYIWPQLQECCNEKQCSLHYQSFSSGLPCARFDLGIVINGVEDQSKQSITQLLGVLKNQLCESALIGLPRNSQWRMSDMIALGFKRSLGQTTDINLDFYDYNMYDYNQKRAWNNSRFWANPERFHDQRW